MGSSAVVVLKPLNQGALKAPTIEEKEPIETLTPGGADVALDV